MMNEAPNNSLAVGWTLEQSKRALRLMPMHSVEFLLPNLMFNVVAQHAKQLLLRYPRMSSWKLAESGTAESDSYIHRSRYRTL